MKDKELYKDTEVGRIPVDWEVRRLGEIADIRTGKRNNEDKLEDGEYPFFVRSQNIERIDSYSYDGEAILVPGEGGIGDIYHYINGKFDYHQRVYKISDFPEDIDGKFVYYYMMQNFRHHALKSTVKATVDSLRLPTFEDFKLYLPPLPEQKAIAKVLSDMDELIESIEKLIHKKKQIKQGAMQELLTGKKRLPGFSGEWEVKRLGELVTIASGESPSKFRMKADGIPYYKVEQLNNCNKYQITTPYYIECKNPIKSESIVFPKRGAAILLNKVRILSRESYIDTNLMALTPTDELYNEYLFYFLIKKELWRIADTTSVPQINNKHIKPLPIPLPPLPEQKAIAQILSDMDDEIEALEKKLDKYKKIKEGMMEKLLTGQVRLV